MSSPFCDRLQMPRPPSPFCGRAGRAHSFSIGTTAAPPSSPGPQKSRSTSSPEPDFTCPLRANSSPVTVRRLMGSVGDIYVMERNNNMWLAGDQEKPYRLELSGVNFDDISEDTLKKTKAWLKFSAKTDKKTTELLKNFHKERQMILKRQQVQMEKLLKDNASEKAAQLRRVPDQSQLLEEKYKKSVDILVMYHSIETIRVDKIHKTEKFDHDKKMLKENHEYFKQLKREAQDAQLISYESYQNSEVLQLTKSIEGIHADRVTKLTADTTLTKEELANQTKDLEEKSDKEIMVKRKQLANTQEIRREQLVEEHKDHIRLLDQLYLKTLKDQEIAMQDEVGRLEHQLREIQEKMPGMRL